MFRALLLAALVLGVGCSPRSGADGQDVAPDWRAQLAAWKFPAPIPSFPLVDQAARPFRVGDLAGKPVVVGFIFTRCPQADACPMTMARLKQVQLLAQGTGLQFLVVTLDPEYDTVGVLAEYARKHEVNVPGFRVATGDKEVVDAFASLFNIIAVRRGGTDITHAVKVALLDDKLTPVKEWTNNDFVPKEILDASFGQ